MELVKSSVLAVLVVLFAVAIADPVGNVSAPGVAPGAGVTEKEPETTVTPTRVSNLPSETPSLVHHSSPPPPVEEKTTVAAATMQNAPGKPEDSKGSASSRNAVYPLIFSTAAVVLFSAYSRV